MTLPRVQPIAPSWRKEPFDDPDWLFDFKYDSFRALYFLEPGHNRLISRNGNVLLATPCRDRAVQVRPSTVASAIQTQAEFGVPVASMGQAITAIGIMRDMPDGGVGSTQRMSPVRQAGDDRYPISPRFGTLGAVQTPARGDFPVYQEEGEPEPMREGVRSEAADPGPAAASPAWAVTGPNARSLQFRVAGAPARHRDGLDEAKRSRPSASLLNTGGRRLCRGPLFCFAIPG